MFVCFVFEFSVLYKLELFIILSTGVEYKCGCELLKKFIGNRTPVICQNNIWSLLLSHSPDLNILKQLRILYFLFYRRNPLHLRYVFHEFIFHNVFLLLLNMLIHFINHIRKWRFCTNLMHLYIKLSIMTFITVIIIRHIGWTYDIKNLTFKFCQLKNKVNFIFFERNILPSWTWKFDLVRSQEQWWLLHRTWLQLLT